MSWIGVALCFLLFWGDDGMRWERTGFGESEAFLVGGWMGYGYTRLSPRGFCVFGLVLL